MMTPILLLLRSRQSLFQNLWSDQAFSLRESLVVKHWQRQRMEPRRGCGQCDVVMLMVSGGKKVGDLSQNEGYAPDELYDDVGFSRFET